MHTMSHTDYTCGERGEISTLEAEILISLRFSKLLAGKLEDLAENTYF